MNNLWSMICCPDFKFSNLNLKPVFAFNTLGWIRVGAYKLIENLLHPGELTLRFWVHLSLWLFLENSAKSLYETSRLLKYSIKDFALKELFLSNFTLALDHLRNVPDVNQAANFVIKEDIENLDLDYWNFSFCAIIIKQVAVRRIDLKAPNGTVLMLVIWIFGAGEWKVRSLVV